MQDIFYQAIDQTSLTTKKTFSDTTHDQKKVSPLYVFED